MAADICKHRRQAAWLCFEPYLTNEQRRQAIEILEQGFQKNGASNLIAYVTKICTTFGIDSRQRKLLYSRFHELMLADLKQSPDPKNAIPGREPYPAPTHETAEAELEPAPEQTAIQPAAAEAEPAETAKPLETASAPLADHTLIFIHFVNKILAHLPEPAGYFAVLAEELAWAKSLPRSTAEALESWFGNPDDFTWSESLDEKTLARVVHLLYTSLCEFLGPIGADASFHKALASCEQLPEAERFNPTRFL